jgi:outer membrane protein OmpA-like peptidoglycan-associated protein
MEVTKIIFTLFIANCLTVGFSQSNRLKEANKLYNKMAYYHAAMAYEDALERGVDSTLIALSIADCYYKIESNAKAVAWYEHIERRSVLNKNQLLTYALVLRQVKKYDLSLEKLKEYEATYGAIPLTRKKISEHYLLDFFASDAGRFETVNQSSVNTNASDFGVAWFTSGQVLISRAVKNSKLKTRSLDHAGDKFYSMYVSKVDDDGNLFSAKRIKGNTTFHDGPGIYDPNTNYVYFTRSNYIKRKRGYDQNKVIRLKILRGELDSKNKLSNVTVLEINSDEFATGHPAITADGKTLFFSSDRPGGFGGTDIWKVSILGDGSTGEPVNLGPTVNTSRNELFPYLDSESSMLFFSSDGHTGLGGLDVFYGYLNADQTKITSLTNMAAPINTEFDDFGFIIDKSLERGYFVSNRDTGMGDDDIYSFKMLKRFEPLLSVEGEVTNCQDNKKLPSSRVILKDESGKHITSAVIDTNGFYRFMLNATVEQKYSVEAEMDGFGRAEESFVVELSDAETRVIRKDLCLGQKQTGIEIASDHNELAIRVLVLDKQTKQPIPNAMVSVFDLQKGFFLGREQTSDEGIFYSPITDKRILDDIVYVVRADKSGYNGKKRDVASVYISNTLIEVVLELDKGSLISGGGGQEFQVCNGEVISLSNIYFDLDKHFIREDAKPELEKIIQLLTECPQMRMEVGSHTDCRASYAYNDALSRRRALATANHIKKRIKNPQRVTAKGYGEKSLAEPCPCEPTNQSDCSEEQHQLNRRTEFRVLSVGVSAQTNVPQKEQPVAAKPSKLSVNESSSIAHEGDTYIIKEGETLYRVFVNTGVSVNELKRLNNLNSNTVYVGQVLRFR